MTGYIDTLALDLYYASPSQDLCGMGLSIDLVVDGIAVLDMEGIGNTTDVNTFQVNDDYMLAQVALTNIADAMENFDILGDETTGPRGRDRRRDVPDLPGGDLDV